MKALITGVTGFAGSHLADYLLGKGVEVWGAKRLNARMRNVKHSREQIQWVDCDLTDPLSVYRMVEKAKPDQIFHLGALSWVTPSWNMPSAYMQTNAVGTINLFEAMRLLGNNARVLVSCTPEEFGDVPAEKLPITEDSAIHPVNPYAASKVAQDAVCTSYFASYGTQIVRTRAFNHEGPRRDTWGALASFAYQIARIEAGKQDPVIKVGNLGAKRNFTDVRDTVRAYAMGLEKCTAGELYLIGRNDQIYTIKECLEMLIGLSTKKDKIKYETEQARIRPTELNYLIGDCSKFDKATGWKPEIAFAKTLEDTLNYWREFVTQGFY